MTVDDFKKLLEFCIHKNGGGGYLSPDEFNRNAPQAESSYLAYLIGEYQKYTPGRPVPVVQFGQNSRVQTSLIPLLYGKHLTVDSTGLAPYPSDFEMVDALSDVYAFSGIYGKLIRFTTEGRKHSFVASTIDPVAQNPVYLVTNSGFQFYPVTIGHAHLAYVRTVPYMVWGYTLDGNGEEVYDPSTSKQPIWSDLDLWDIAVRCLEILGVRLQQGQVQQYANLIKQNGQ